MDIVQRCQEIRAQVEGELSAAADATARTEVLVQGLYRLGESVLSEMGPPGRSEKYLRMRGAALDLIVFLCVRLVRGAHRGRDLVSVVVEVAEGSPDPVLQKKLTGYARQLLVQAPEGGGGTEGEGPAWRRYLAGVAGAACVVTTLLLVAQQTERSAVLSRGEGPAQLVRTAPPAPIAAAGPAVPAPTAPPPSPTESAAKRTALHGEKPEQLTRIRVVANQVLVPATVRNGGESVRVTLLLDTGSTRTALNEKLAAKLGVDLARARGSLVEVADGRVLQSKLATVDLLSVGARTVPAFEMEFFPYSGSDQGFDGFLGMDFLSRQRYQLDVEHEVIRWF